MRLAIAVILIFASFAGEADARCGRWFPRLWARRHAVRAADLNPQPLPPGSVQNSPGCSGGQCSLAPPTTPSGDAIPIVIGHRGPGQPGGKPAPPNVK
jgi:hypothetical protein